MRTSRWLAGGVVLALSLFSVSDAPARPGGGSSFKGSSRSSSSSSSRSSWSSSSSRSSGSSSRSSSSGSSWSSNRSSSSGSSWSSSSGSGSGSSGSYTPYTPTWAIRATSGKSSAKLASAPGVSVYAAPPAHAAVPIAADYIPLWAKATSFLLGGGFFMFVVSLVTSPFWLIAFVVARARRKKKLDAEWSSTAAAVTARGAAPEREQGPAEVRRAMEAIRAGDPDFSIIVLEDFLSALYAEAHVARGAGTLDRVAPYLRPNARQALASLPRAAVAPVIVGAIAPNHFSRDDRARVHRLKVDFESNYTESPPGRTPQSYYACERWTLSRAFGARSRQPSRARALVCPSCGAPLERTVHGRCTYCGQATDSGQFDWVVESIEILSREERGPMLTGTTDEVGTSAPTIVDGGLSSKLAELERAGAPISQEALFGRVRTIHAGMQQAWSSLQWNDARPLLTDRLWNAQVYWIEAYRQQGLRNMMDEPKILRIELVRAGWDRFYLAATVRIHATGRDYTIRAADGSVVGGSRTKERPYTEYWTLVRSAAKHGAAGHAACPACGAPLPAAMTGKCGHCGALVESAAFDWVLSRIEQDEVYAG